MKNVIVPCETIISGHESFTRSAFMIDETEENELSPFSFKNIFKKKDDGASQTSQSSSTTVKDSGSGVGNAIVTGLAGLLGSAGSIATILPSIGIGSKSRIAETNATAAANALIYNAQTQSTLATIEAEKSKSKETEKLVMIGFVVVLVIVIVIAVLFTKK